MFNSTHVQHQHPPPVNSPYGFSKRLPSMNSTPNGAVDSHEAAGDTQEIAMYERHPQEPVRPLSSTSRSYSISHHQSPTASASMPSISSIPSSSSSSSSTSSSSSHDASGRIGSPKYSYAMSNSSGSDLHVLPRFQQPLTRPSPTQPHMSSESTTSTADDHPALSSALPPPVTNKYVSRSEAEHVSSINNLIQQQKSQREIGRAAQLHAANTTSTGKRPRKKPVSPDMAEKILNKMCEPVRQSKKHVIDDDLFKDFVDVWIDVHNDYGMDPGDEGNFKHWFKNQKRFFRIIDETKRKSECQFDTDSGMITFSSEADRQDFIEKHRHLVPDIGEKIKKPYKVYSLIKELDMKRLSSKHANTSDGMPLDTMVEMPMPGNSSSTTTTHQIRHSSSNSSLRRSLDNSEFKGRHFQTVLSPSVSENPESQLSYPQTQDDEVSPAPSSGFAHQTTPTPTKSIVTKYTENVSFLQVVDEMDGFTKDEKARFLSAYLPFNTDPLFKPVDPSTINDIRRLMKYTIYCMKKSYISSNSLK